MKPDWDKLAADFEGSDKVLIADADCTAGGKPLCDKFGVRGYPTLKVFAAGDEDGEEYKGGRDPAALKKFASEMGPGCTVDNMEVCTAEEKEKLEKYVAMDASERAAKIAALSSSLKDAESAHEKLLETLQAQLHPARPSRHPLAALTLNFPLPPSPPSFTSPSPSALTLAPAACAHPTQMPHATLTPHPTPLTPPRSPLAGAVQGVAGGGGAPQGGVGARAQAAQGRLAQGGQEGPRGRGAQEGRGLSGRLPPSPPRPLMTSSGSSPDLGLSSTTRGRRTFP